MIGVEFDSSKIAEAIKGLQKINDQVIPTIDAAVGQTAADGSRVIIEATPHRTGNLRRGFQLAHLGPTIFYIFNLVKYAPFVEDDTEPHTIRAVNHRVLGNPKVGFFGKEVNHPGTKGAHMVAKSIAKIQKMLDDNIDAALLILTRWKSA